MMSHPELKDAILPPTVDHHMVKHIFSLLDCPEIEDQVIVRKMAALDFINRIFAVDQNCKMREIFLENGIYQKLNFILDKSAYKNDKHSLILSTASLSLVNHLLSTPTKPHKSTIPLHFLEYFLTIISENKLDSPVKLAVSCLCFLNWEEFKMRNYFIHLFGFETLLKTAKCSTRDVMIDIIKVFANFVIKVKHNTKVHLISVGILKYIVEICDMYLQNKIQFGGNADNLLRQCMIFLNNFMFKFYRGKLEFYKLGGMKIITKLYFVHTDEKFCKIFIERILKILLYSNSQRKHSDFFIYMKSGKPTLRKRYPPALKLVEESLSDRQLQTDIILWNKSSTQSKEVIRSYEIKSVVPFVSDSTHAIMPKSTSFPAQIDEVGIIACGMLNCQKNCTIYFGINYNSQKVEGINVDRDMKDKFRLACDTIFNTLMKPTVYMSSNVDVEFIPIKNGENVIPDLFIAEILIKPYSDFFSFKNKTYFRYNSETILINAEMLQLLVIMDESKQWRRKEEKWLKKLNELKASRRVGICQPESLS